jgi:hypothetical protein
MIRAIWIHQFDQLAERTVDDIAQTLKPRDIDYVYVKAMDGMHWMGHIYDHPLAPLPTNFAQTVADFELCGLVLVPWVVPRGANPVIEAQTHARCADLAHGSIIVDFEYRYAQFFDQGDIAAWLTYKATLQAANGMQWCAVAPDPRQPGRDYDQYVLSGFDAILPQTYWSDFQQGWQTTLDAADAALNTLLIPKEPILPWNAPPQEINQAMIYLDAGETDAVSLWRMGVANEAVLDAFAGYIEEDDDGTYTPDGEGDEMPCASLINALGFIAGDVIRPLRTFKNKKVRQAIATIDRVARDNGIGG